MVDEEPDTPVFIDGPLRGRADMCIPDHVRHFGYWHQPPIERVPGVGPLSYRQPDVVIYHFTLMPVLGRIVLIGSVKQPPDEDDLFAALISPVAKAVAVRERLPQRS